MLLFLLIFYFLKDIYLADPKVRDYATCFIVSFILLVSNFMHWLQEARFSSVVDKLKKIVSLTASVKRSNQIFKISLNELLVGDIVLLSAGDIIPADIRLLETKDFFVKETTFTGESDPVEKNAFSQKETNDLLDDPRLVFMGTNVVSGYAVGIVVLIGLNTYLGHVHQSLDKEKHYSSLKKGINSIVKILIGCILILFPLIFALNWYKCTEKFIFWNIFAFALSIILGITPEMLPLIVTTSFMRGVAVLSKYNVIVKNLYSMQDFGAIDILFTDKTGTLTEDSVAIENFLDTYNKSNFKILQYAYLNSYFQTGLKNVIDKAIIDKMHDNCHFDSMLVQHFIKVDEIPFDFKRRIMTISLRNIHEDYDLIITKGAIEEILNICNYSESIDPNTNQFQIFDIDKPKILNYVIHYNQLGFRVIGVAYKLIQKNLNSISNDNKNIENNMIMLGFLILLDPPKVSSADAVLALKSCGVDVKILTGDNEILSKIIAHKVNIDSTKCLLGSTLIEMSDEEIYKQAHYTSIFAKLYPEQKARIINIFQKKGHIVGFIGDGINDAIAMKNADLSITVDSGAEVAKESADVILLNKNLTVLKDAILEGRKNYINMLKYIKFTLASNFGNILSILLASYLLPFIPFMPIQILCLNLIYDLSCLVLPFDDVEPIYLQKKSRWDSRNLCFFMITFGILTFIFDVLFCSSLLWRYGIFSSSDWNCDKINLFRAGWFIFSIWTQFLTIFYLRTPNCMRNFKKTIYIFAFPFLAGVLTSYLPCISFLSERLYFSNPFNKDYVFILVIFLLLYFLSLYLIKKLFIINKRDLV
ncbi:magnesium-translocating P-type ATPase ['Bonamia sp.' little leaf phytoplasma]|uniref:Magnesium-translocating P-type ATPase n=1 Tax=Candidatus Phytoplasma bonamiae TaxID=2982626 RepID=A0ABT9D3X8_9MOLU|nr:magnesium-translocating P-type ATPase ['Bonamia sp.' little leaf phytoplasma]